MTTFFLLIKTITFLIAIIFLIRITLTYLNKYNQKQAKTIEIIDRISVGKESSIAIVLVCKKYYLMSISATNNELIKELDEEDIRELLNKQQQEQELRQMQQEKILNQVSTFGNFFKKSTKENKNEK